MWFRVRESHPPNHVTHWSFHHVIFQIPTFARAMATSFSKMWLKLSYRVTWLIYHVITLYRKRCISSFSTPRTITMKLGRVMSYGEGTPSILSINLTITWLCLFWKKTYPPTQGHRTAGDTKHRKTHESKAFFVTQKNINIEFISI